MATPDHPDSTRHVAVTRHEEELRLGVTSRAVERVRVRKVVVTEPVTITVTVRREEIRFETVAVDDVDTASGAWPDVPADYDVLLHEFVLRDEVPVVELQAVARERVRVYKTVRTTATEVSTSLRSERVDVDTNVTHRDVPNCVPEPGSTEPGG